MADGSTLLNDKTLEMLVVLRMNRSGRITFSKSACGRIFLEIKALQPFNVADVVPDIEETERGSQAA